MLPGHQEAAVLSGALITKALGIVNWGGRVQGHFPCGLCHLLLLEALGQELTRRAESTVHINAVHPKTPIHSPWPA
jgi:hypothetical protein